MILKKFVIVFSYGFVGTFQDNVIMQPIIPPLFAQFGVQSAAGQGQVQKNCLSASVIFNLVK